VEGGENGKQASNDGMDVDGNGPDIELEVEDLDMNFPQRQRPLGHPNRSIVRMRQSVVSQPASPPFRVSHAYSTLIDIDCHFSNCRRVRHLFG
jgi:hypothetical protein